MWKKKLYIRNNPDPFLMNRTKLDLFADCRRCFYFDLIAGIKRPHGPPQVINNAINQVLKNEFNAYRLEEKPHPIMMNIKQNLLPAKHKDLEVWRNNFKGVQFLHKKTNLKLSGSITDLWVDKDTDEFVLVEYKSTAKKDTIKHDQIWPGYWKQLSFYKYLFEKNEISINENGYIIILNASKKSERLNEKLTFETKIFTQKLDINWIEEQIYSAYKILQLDIPPPLSNNCKYCNYVNLAKIF